MGRFEKHYSKESGLPLDLGPSYPKVQVKDKETGKWGTGVGSTWEEAEARAIEDAIRKNCEKD